MFGQDLMRGEHVVGSKAKSGLTWTGKAAQFDGYRVQNGERAATDTSGTSIFDPVLCELVYRWFCRPGGTVIDPFAGGSVRGIVASLLGRAYIGVDLSARQIEANREQATRIAKDPLPSWIVGDSVSIRDLVPPETAVDLVFSCPPYGDLERYSDDPQDLSTMAYGKFIVAYRKIISACVAMLNVNAFACFVVGDIRDRKGFYRSLPADTIRAFEDAGARLYNEAVLVTAVGSLPIRAAKQFEASRKLGKTHQNVLVFCKGDPKVATEAVGPVEFGLVLPGDPPAGSGGKEPLDT